MPSRTKKTQQTKPPKTHRGILYKFGRIWIKLTQAYSDFGGQTSRVRKSNYQIYVVRKECFLHRRLLVGFYFSVTNQFSCLGVSAEIFLYIIILCQHHSAMELQPEPHPIWACEVPQELESSPTCTRPPEESGMWLTETGNLSPWDENM